MEVQFAVFSVFAGSKLQNCPLHSDPFKFALAVFADAFLELTDSNIKLDFRAKRQITLYNFQ